MTLPLGTPPIPNARSIDSAPVDIEGIFLTWSDPSSVSYTHLTLPTTTPV